MRLRPGPAALLGCSLIAATLASLNATTTDAATVINTSAVRVTLDLRDQIDGLQQVFVTITCAPVSINPPIDTETALLIPDVPTKDLRFPGFTATTTCKIDAVVTSSPAVGGLAVDVNGTVVAGPIVAQQISVSGVVPGLSPQVKIVLSKAALPATTTTSATSASTTSTSTSTIVAAAQTQATTTSTALSFSAPGADASSVGSVPLGATTTTSAAPTTATTVGAATTIAPVQARSLAVPLARTIAIVTTTTLRVAKLAKPTTTTTIKKPVAKKSVKTKPTTTVRKKVKIH